MIEVGSDMYEKTTLHVWTRPSKALPIAVEQSVTIGYDEFPYCNRIHSAQCPVIVPEWTLNSLPFATWDFLGLDCLEFGAQTAHHLASTAVDQETSGVMVAAKTFRGFPEIRKFVAQNSACSVF